MICRYCERRRTVPIPRPRLPRLDDAMSRLLTALRGASGDSMRAVVDLDEIARELGMKPLTLRIALVGLRVRGEIAVLHSPDRFERVTVSFPPSECSP